MRESVPSPNTQNSVGFGSAFPGISYAELLLQLQKKVTLKKQSTPPVRVRRKVKYFIFFLEIHDNYSANSPINVNGSGPME